MVNAHKRIARKERLHSDIHKSKLTLFAKSDKIKKEDLVL